VTELRDRWQRAAADLANLRRRTEQEKSEVEKFASMLLIQELLPVLDNFERALATIPGNLQMLTWIQGVMLVERQLRAILERRGLAAIETKGQPFSAHYHEAISERQTSEEAPGTVLQEYQRGYTMHGMVIRPSLVEVAAAESREESPAEPERPAEPPQETAETTDQTTGEEIAAEAETENVGP
jgi:molecular chaperone GrpE